MSLESWNFSSYRYSLRLTQGTRLMQVLHFISDAGLAGKQAIRPRARGSSAMGARGLSVIKPTSFLVLSKLSAVLSRLKFMLLVMLIFRTDSG